MCVVSLASPEHSIVSILQGSTYKCVHACVRVRACVRACVRDIEFEFVGLLTEQLQSAESRKLMTGLVQSLCCCPEPQVWNTYSDSCTSHCFCFRLEALDSSRNAAPNLLPAALWSSKEAHAEFDAARNSLRGGKKLATSPVVPCSLLSCPAAVTTSSCTPCIPAA